LPAPFGPTSTFRSPRSTRVSFKLRKLVAVICRRVRMPRHGTSGEWDAREHDGAVGGSLRWRRVQRWGERFITGSIRTKGFYGNTQQLRQIAGAKPVERGIRCSPPSLTMDKCRPESGFMRDGCDSWSASETLDRRPGRGVVGTTKGLTKGGNGPTGSRAWAHGVALGQYLTRRSLHSLISLAGLIVLVSFLARLTGDPTGPYLPLDASLEASAEFAEKHGFDDPLIEQFGRFLRDLARNNAIAVSSPQRRQHA